MSYQQQQAAGPQNIKNEEIFPSFKYVPLVYQCIWLLKVDIKVEFCVLAPTAYFWLHLS
jgi:hypothetical protein